MSQNDTTTLPPSPSLLDMQRQRCVWWGRITNSKIKKEDVSSLWKNFSKVNGRNFYAPSPSVLYPFYSGLQIFNWGKNSQFTKLSPSYSCVDITVSAYEEHSSLKITCARLYIPGGVLTCSNISMASNSLPSFINAPPMARRTDWSSALTSCS